MEFATGALGALLPKLSMLLHGEYNLEKGVRGDIQRVMSKLERVHAALRHVGEVPVPLEQIIRPGIVNMWARDVGELSYDMEDFVDTFLVRVQGPERTSKRRYGVGTIVPTVKTLFYPRIIALNYTKATDLVGIDEAREELITRLTKEYDTSTEQRQVSIVGFGGLGKTALAKAVYNKLKAKGEFHCAAFVSMSRYPKLVEIFKELLYELDKTEYKDVISTPMEIDELINLVHEFLNKKRYLIAVDDIWDTDAWAMIRYAFAENKLGSRIIVTTRRIDVAEYVGGCCYMMKPLTREKSKILFYGRTFGSEGKCPPELSHASEKILNKCGGVPLAIITISSLLASKSKNIKEWFYLADSIGSGILERSAEMEIMWKILLRSYSDLPARLKTCLLYLSIFPEDCEIGMHRLIWRWIAEGFFNGELAHGGLFKIGESCFHELIRRSMVQPVTLEGTGLVYACRVHNMFHDLILSMSHEEQFVSVVNEKFGPLDVLSRRLAFQNIKKSQYRLVEHPRLAQSRSLNAIGCPIYAIPPIESYKSLRVLDFENCAGIEDHDLVHLGKLHHLKFLGLRNTFIGKLPEGIGNLKFLQTLDLDGTGVEELPQALHNLTELMCLIADWRTRVPNWIGNLTSLQHLVIYPGGHDDEDSASRLAVPSAAGASSLASSLSRSLRWKRRLPGLPSLTLRSGSAAAVVDAVAFRVMYVVEAVVLGLALSCFFLCAMGERDLEILGGFPVLHSLHLLIVNTEREHVMTCGCGGFKNLKCCSITKPLKFVHGAMPRLEVLDFHFSVQLLTDSNQEFDFDFGLGNLHWLQQAIVQITALGEEVESVGRAQVALRDAIRTHLNRPTLEINLFGQTIPPELPKQDDDGAKIVEISPAESSRQAQEREKRSIDVATKKATRVPSFYTKSSIDEPMDQLINMLSVVDDEAYTKNIKILSIVRSEGLGKTTLAQKAFEELHSQFDRGAFVLLGQNPDLRRVFADILRGLDKQRYIDFPVAILDLVDLIWLVRKSLINKRFFIVFDDICDVKAWEIIKCALIENNNHSVVLTTSRNTGITEIIGGSKQLQPLSATISKNLLCKRLFGSAGKCPSELVNICDNLVEECGGILSVIDETVTLLASIPPTVENWEAVYARRMLDRSYPGLTDSLKNCLLYFTMFRRGHEISGEHLICAWIAEGFVHGQEVAETYLSDLVKKKLIDAVEVDAGGKVLTCRMYDLVHDFIVSKSIEERFVYILNDSEGRDLSEAVHVHQRLYIQGHNNKELDLQIPWLPQVKSLVSCGTAPSILKFKGLHVMDLGACESLQASHLKGINNVSSLRYLVIGGKCISGIPKEIAKLEHLRTLDLSASGLNELPEYVFMIRKLERLIVNSQMKISYGIAKMSALQELGDINVTDPELLKSLCKLTKLRVLRISIWSWDDSLKNYFKQLCDNLRSLVQCTENIQSLSIMTCCSLVFMDDLGENWTPQCLQKLEVGCSAFDILPSWFGSLSSISTLTIEVYKLSQDIIDTLGRLAGLGSLSLTSKQVPKGYFVIGSDRFNKLQSLKFVSNAMVEMFPRQQSNGTEQLKRLMIVFHASRTQDVNKDFCFGLENLSSLEHVRVEIICFDASHNMVKNAEAAVQKAISGTSIANLEIRRLQENSMTQDEADLCDAVQEQNNQKHQKMKRY
ncbi:hypothetical protein ZEAMMB73_Zm00001d037650 [Zea mays]|uniref:Disease resistance protein RPM1 n=1 Tax=Zea mays TaxID=4577 RepID=A0A1D6LZM2_MAIZE|nr:hypothetical protein ZEAMMB73_Zm00001d037650 [Zea mays]